MTDLARHLHDEGIVEGIVRDDHGTPRCAWCMSDPIYRRYHDDEWGRPLTDDRRLFEKLCLEGFQAGLSWLTVLKKREDFRRVFLDFEPLDLVRFEAGDVERALSDSGIIRHRGKIEAVVANAQVTLDTTAQFGSFAAFLWQFAPARQERQDPGADPPTQSAESRNLSKALKTRGWRFLGPTSAYAFMQSVGMVNDHNPACHVHAEIETAQSNFGKALRAPASDVG